MFPLLQEARALHCSDLATNSLGCSGIPTHCPASNKSGFSFRTPNCLSLVLKSPYCRQRKFRGSEIKGKSVKMNLKDFRHCVPSILAAGTRATENSSTLNTALTGEEDALCLPYCYAPKLSVVIVSPSRFLPKLLVSHCLIKGLFLTLPTQKG